MVEVHIPRDGKSNGKISLYSMRKNTVHEKKEPGRRSNHVMGPFLEPISVFWCRKRELRQNTDLS